MNRKFEDLNKLLESLGENQSIFGGQSGPTRLPGQCTEICVEYCPYPATGKYLGNVQGGVIPDPDPSIHPPIN